MVKKIPAKSPANGQAQRPAKAEDNKAQVQRQLPLLFDTNVLSKLVSLSVSAQTAQYVLELMQHAILTGDQNQALLFRDIRGMIHTERQKQKRHAGNILTMAEIVAQILHARKPTSRGEPCKI